MFTIKKNKVDLIEFTPEEIVRRFLNIHKNWWRDPNNSLFNKKEEARKFLTYFLKKGREPDYVSHEMIYVLTKFEAEFLPWFKKVKNARISA